MNAASEQHYGRFFSVLLFVIVAVALTITVYGFTTTPEQFVAAAKAVTPATLAPLAIQPANSFSDFVSVCASFVFAYAGLGAGPVRGGEVTDAPKRVPRGIYYGWAVALVLFTLAAMTQFHAAPWWAVTGLIKAGKGNYATGPGLIGLAAPQWLTVVLNLAVALIDGKTLAPALMVSSQVCFARAQDHLLSPVFAKTSARKVPLAALVLIAVLGSLFLVQAVFAGWAMGVAVWSLAVLAVWLALAIGASNLGRHAPRRDAEWAKAIMRRKLVVPASIVSSVLAVPLIVSLAAVPHTALWLQPLFQGAVVVAVGAVILAIAQSRATQPDDSLPARTALVSMA